MQMEAGLDTGPTLAKLHTPIDGKTTGELTAELAELGAGMMVEVLHDLPGYAATPQDDALATYAAKIDKAEARVDWTLSAPQIERLVRALAPFPGAWFELEGERVKLLRAELVAASGAPGTVLDADFTIPCGRSDEPTSELQSLMRI